MTIETIRSLIRDVPDFPKPGIVFKDITPLLSDADGFGAATELLAERASAHRPDAIVAIESRGFLFGAALARKLHLPLHLVRKAGKLPHETASVTYDLEYGTDRVEIHIDAVGRGQRCAVVDDLIATGGTAAATGRLLEDQGAEVACHAFVIELSFLHGRERLESWPVETLVQF